MSETMGKFEARMNRFAEVIDKHIAPPLVKIGNQRHFAAIRAALIRTIPLIIVGSLPLIITNFPIAKVQELIAPFSSQLNVLYAMSFGFTTLYLVISLARELSALYDNLDPTIVSIVSLASFLIAVTPISLETNTIEVTGFSAKGMFAAFIITIFVVEFMNFAYKHNIVIRMPRAVPKNIADSFAVLVPMFLLLVFFWFIRIILGFDIYLFIEKLVSPLMVISDTWYAAFITSLLLQMLWFVGIHGGSFTIWGVLYPFLLANIAENSAAAVAGQPIPNIITEPFFYTYAIIGGVGITLPLVFIMWKSKSSLLREVSRVSLIPAIFCINEPVMFGVPIVLNPIMFLPFVFGTTLLGTVYGYVLTKLGWVSPAIIHVPWTTPPLLQPYLSTGGDWRAVIAQLVLIIIVGFIWYPFAKIWERRCLEEESKNI
ncbi:PTS sugar transporter subunit IIC [Tepidimicrobium xylanilyticum]|uniref:PTS sugar transporter subunit IIC n=1 Tax=Tepidimicrobium xylanilyticum TaxID=1123352 RepID=UPI00264E6000|nr:PTS transporter subunit EIIC [Tepidimicrobium xylanilyticum]GMG97770.1 permease IIC component [Tepidimicrobium xylanilyticum]